MTLIVVDLFSGLGGFSQAFLYRGHKIYRFDNDPRFKKIPYTSIVDVMDLTPDDIPDADIILASPPCQCFSCASVWRHWKCGQPVSEKAKKAIRLVKHTLSLIHAKAPRFWVMENPVGLLQKVIGPAAILTHWAAWGHPYYKPTHLWGLLPAMTWPRPTEWTKAPGGTHHGAQETDGQVTKRITKWYNEVSPINPFKYARVTGPVCRSLIPYKFSEALCIAAEKGGGQSLLSDY